MLSLCNTSRGKLACALCGVLGAGLALACLWAFSPTVNAGDGPAPVGPPAKACSSPVPSLGADVGLPPIPGGVASAPVNEKDAAEDTAPAKSGPTPPPLPATGKKDAPPPLPPVVTEKKDALPPSASLPPVAGSSQAPPPSSAGEPLPPSPSPPITQAAGVEKVPPPPTPPVPPVSDAKASPSTTPSAPPAGDSQDIKQLVTQLSELRADRAKLDEKERQTIQTIKKKYQDQKHALEQLERELRELGINCDEGTAAPPPVRPTPIDAPLPPAR
jgi:hypothetical protein